MPTLTLTKQEQFFYDHAGFSHDPKVETAAQGHERSAREYAQAETYAREQGWYFDWQLEQESPKDVFGPACPRGSKCVDEKCTFAHYNPRAEFYVCLLRDEIDGKVLASCGMIESPDKNHYRRVMEAELAFEAMP